MNEPRRSTSPTVGITLLAAIALIAILTPLLRDTPPAAPLSEDNGAGGTNSTQGPVLAVKIDNVPAARPQTGLGSADVVYVEPVEGGWTRLAALYSDHLPAEVGPVRSARESDIELLTQYAKPTLAYSGAAPELTGKLNASSLNLASPTDVPSAYSRDNSRPEPHNLFVKPQELPQDQDTSATAAQAGPAPSGGKPTQQRNVPFGQANYGFSWEQDSHGWSVSLDGSALVSTESGPVDAATVVVQRVGIRTGSVGDASRNSSPVAMTVGSGAATMLRDGKEFNGTWSRNSPSESTTFRTDAGEDLPIAGNPVWVLLVPA